jgi:hypothetical protein
MDRYTSQSTKCSTLRYSFSGRGTHKKPITLNGTPVEEKLTDVHLGVLQGPSPKLNEQRIREQTLKATGAMYGLFGAGLHARTGFNPVASKEIWSTFVLSRLLYGSEVWMLKPQLIAKLEHYQVQKLKQLQGLPDRVSNTATLGLVGQLPIEAEIHKKCLTLFRNCIADKDQIEYKIAQRQLAMKNSNSHSWFIYINNILEKYHLPSAYELLARTPSKGRWSRQVNKSVGDFWEAKFLQEAEEKPSIRFMSQHSLSPTHPAILWSSTLESLRDTHQAYVKVKLLTGCYKLQVHEAMFKRNQHATSSLCRLCSSGAEDRSHFLLTCPALEDARKPHKEQLISTLQIHNISLADLSELQLLHIVLDAGHSALKQLLPRDNQLHIAIERISRQWIHSLHATRWKLLELRYGGVRRRGEKSSQLNPHTVPLR